MDFAENTQHNVGGFPSYRCRDNDRTVIVNNVSVSNQWVVPC